MNNLDDLKKFIGGLKPRSSVIAGIAGMTTQPQSQTEQLKKSFGLWYQNQDDKKLRKDFYEALLLAETTGVISTDEMNKCLIQMGEK